MARATESGGVTIRSTRPGSAYTYFGWSGTKILSASLASYLRLKSSTDLAPIDYVDSPSGGRVRILQERCRIHCTSNGSYSSVLRAHGKDRPWLGGQDYVRGHDLLALPNCSPESVFALEIAHDADAPLTAQVASVQASLLYTTSSGERRIRVHTLVAPVSADLGQIADSADVDALANVMAKAGVEAAFKSGLEAARSRLQQKCVDIATGGARGFSRRF